MRLLNLALQMDFFCKEFKLITYDKKSLLTCLNVDTGFTVENAIKRYHNFSFLNPKT